MKDQAEQLRHIVARLKQRNRDRVMLELSR